MLLARVSRVRARVGVTVRLGLRGAVEGDRSKFQGTGEGRKQKPYPTKV